MACCSFIEMVRGIMDEGAVGLKPRVAPYPWTAAVASRGKLVVEGVRVLCRVDVGPSWRMPIRNGRVVGVTVGVCVSTAFRAGVGVGDGVLPLFDSLAIEMPKATTPPNTEILPV